MFLFGFQSEIIQVSEQHVVRNLKHRELQRIPDHLNQADNMLKNMVEKGTLTQTQGQSVQNTILDKMESVRRLTLLLELLWLDVEGPAFVNCGEHLAAGLKGKNQKQSVNIMMSFDQFKKLIWNKGIVADDLLKGWLVLDFSKLTENVLVGDQNHVKEVSLNESHFVESWDVYGSRPGKDKSVSLRMSFVTSALESVLKKVTAASLSHSERLEEWFRLWLDFVEERERRSQQVSEVLACQLLLITTPYQEVDYLAKKQKTGP